LIRGYETLRQKVKAAFFFLPFSDALFLLKTAPPMEAYFSEGVVYKNFKMLKIVWIMGLSPMSTIEF